MACQKYKVKKQFQTLYCRSFRMPHRVLWERKETQIAICEIATFSSFFMF